MTEVEPERVVSAMTEHWQTTGNSVSPALQNTWHEMCSLLNDIGQSSSKDKWTALAMPTGTGKSMLSAVYCSLLPNPELSVSNFKSKIRSPGVLYVTRFTQEADSFAKLVNKLTGKATAAAFHSGPECIISADEACSFPVLAITHSANEQYQRRVSDDPDEDTLWDKVTCWHDTRRAKVIIDETPNFISSSKVTALDIGDLLSANTSLADANERLFRPIKDFHNKITSPLNLRKERNLTVSELADMHGIDTTLLLEWVSTASDSDLQMDQPDKRNRRLKLRETLLSLAVIQRNGWAYLSYIGKKIQINSAQMHPSLRDGGGLILDGTASLYSGYELLGEKLRVVTPRKNPRTYANVTLYVSRGHSVGKEHLNLEAEKQWPAIEEAITSELIPGSKLLVVCHKDVRDRLERFSKRNFTFAHYNYIDGKNDWRYYDAIAIYGLPYLPEAHPKNLVLTAIGPQSDQWHQNSKLRKCGTHADIIEAVHTGHIAASVVQAINRIRCRSIVDVQGNCKPARVFCLLPGGGIGDAVLSAIKLTCH